MTIEYSIFDSTQLIHLCNAISLKKSLSTLISDYFSTRMTFHCILRESHAVENEFEETEIIFRVK